ncbi:UDP-N-acetylmuramoyl-L-alanine--D-glutamate ligase [Paradevosia shaoguanensis]|uniref:UDP-N-acetylmuramoyl-L-alanine--L-glutamate ligase n=1 Tax=Paradevosia shaoguanensis TaxID=1335043 RepID=A0AA41QR24_9HYPH|nr:UDP-N-acetylmuramoyl-L-alanine--D-glutamate ligase [Paradevosia shaoguanensis]MCF1743593.1 UDP-N-acetylmuramoyl-L-alanine--D-glutamate ligase [Paradevosia shaoguanensis]MCI0128076.1 UDP-N-acetylmuramoyl-L-alanine--D-glutamate ligase [Paradevosia shaoguanensis]
MHFDAPVLLYGAGREARSTRDFIRTHSPGTKVYVTVDSGDVGIEDVEIIAPSDLQDAIAARRFGTIVKSPGVSRYRPIFAIAREAGIAVTSNLNLWGEEYRSKVKVVAISGTKGKSTTATLTWLMLTNSGVDAGLGGNVGVAPLDVADKYKTVVFELSSYQTADMAFTPDIAAITNLSPEHTDWHRDVEHYYADKLNLIDRDKDFPVALGVGAKDNKLVLEALRNPARLVPALDRESDQAIVDAVSISRLKGAHNLDNARLAAQIALAAGGTLEGVLKGIAEFKPLPHRLEEHIVGGMLFVNDSISTTPEATKAALAAFPSMRIALIAGGHERNQDYTELATLLAPRGVTVLVCLPVTGDRLATATYAAAPQIEVLEAENLETAMQALSHRRNRFDAVILSPGAPSYNQFKNFEERGNTFIALAEKLFGEKVA